MGLWQKLFGWMNPSAPTATHADQHSSANAVQPVEPGFAASYEPAFDPSAELAAPAPSAAAHDDPTPNIRAQPDLFEAAAQAEADRLVALPEVIRDPALRDALSVYAGMAWDRQMDFAEKVGDRPWSADTSQGLIQFGDDVQFRMQVLGSYSHQSGMWQWIWAITQAEVAPAYTEVARQLQGFGNAQQLALFSQPRSELRPEDLHAIGLIASGADESAGYYLGDYGDGILLALIDPGQGLPIAPTSKPERVLTVVPQLISQFELNHCTLLRHYLAAKGFAVQEADTQISAKQGASELVAKFDEQGRLTGMTGNLKA